MNLKRTFSIFLAISLVLLTANAVLAGSILINDDPTIGSYTQGEQWSSGQTVGGTYFGSGNFTGYGHSDAVGDQFATRKIEITTTPGFTTINIWTNNQPGGWRVPENGANWGVADIALNLNSSTAGYTAYTTNHFGLIQSSYETAIIMQDYLTGTPGQSGSGVISLVQVGTWETSWDKVNPSGGLIYNGAYKGSEQPVDAKKQPAETKVQNYTNVLAEGTISWELDGLQGPGGFLEYVITISLPTVPGLDTSYEAFWGTSLCANDPVHATVPLPASILLLGSGLLGLVMLGRRKLIKR